MSNLATSVASWGQIKDDKGNLVNVNAGIGISVDRDTGVGKVAISLCGPGDQYRRKTASHILLGRTNEKSAAWDHMFRYEGDMSTLKKDLFVPLTCVFKYACTYVPGAVKVKKVRDKVNKGQYKPQVVFCRNRGSNNLLREVVYTTLWLNRDVKDLIDLPSTLAKERMDEVAQALFRNALPEAIDYLEKSGTFRTDLIPARSQELPAEEPQY